MLAIFALTAVNASGQTPAPTPATPTMILGEVTVVDAANNVISVKTKDGDVLVMLNDKTIYLQAKPGATDLKDATPITLAEIGVGDGVIAQGRLAEDKKSMPGRRVVVMTKSDIAQKHERDRADWQKRGIVGRITALNTEAKEISLVMRAPGGERPITLASSDKVKFRRYAPDSVKFSDAKTSSFAELKVGDQVRALGDRSADGMRFTPEEVVSGSFRMVGGAITVVNPATNEITINNLQTGQPLTVVVNKDSVMRRIPPEMATMLAQRRAQAGAAGGAAAPAGGGQPAQGEGQPRAGRGGDMDEMIERLPQVAITELKKGDVIAVSSTTGVDPSRVTAIKLVAGIEALMTRPQGQAGGGAQSPSLNLPGLDSIGGP